MHEQMNSISYRTLKPVAVIGALLLLCVVSGWVRADDLVLRAKQIHERVITLDTHVDISTDTFTAQTNYLTDPDTQVDIPRMEAGGLDAAFFIVYVGQGPLTEAGFAAAYQAAVDKFDAIHWMTKELAPDRIGLALTPKDVYDIANSGRKVALIGVENCSLG